MQVIRGTTELAQPLAGSVVTIGNFDGVHLAHRELFRHVVESARRAGTPAVAMTFDPHPAAVLAPGRVPKALTPLDLKLSLIEKCGIDLVWVIPFTKSLAELSAGDFVQRFLARQLRAGEVFVGSNFRFGRNREGNVELLTRLGIENQFCVATIPLLEVRGERVSSSRIRKLVADGKVSKANRLLGRPFAVEGQIVSGEGIGRKQTVPTLNLDSVAQQLPADGVYVTRTRLGAKAWDSVANVGEKPTFGPHPRTVETYLLDFNNDVKADRMQIDFLCRLRAERTFPNAETLKVQILKDVARARKYFRLRARLLRMSESPVN